MRAQLSKYDGTPLRDDAFFDTYAALLCEYFDDLGEIDRVKYILRKNAWKIKKRAGIELIGIEPNPGPLRNVKTYEKLLQAVNQMSVSKMPQKKGKGRRRRSKNNGSSSISRMANQVGGIPAAFGFVAPRSYFRTSSAAQRLADQDPTAAIRCHGCAKFSAGITGYSTAGGSGGSAMTTHGGFGTSSLPDQGEFALAPNEIDPRLSAIAQTYQYYAFRKIVLKYIPFVGTSTNGGLYMAIAKDYLSANYSFLVVGASTGNSPGTSQQVLDYNPSLMTAIWQPAELTFQHVGTKLWETYPAGEEPLDARIQASIVALIENVVVANTTSYTPGHLWLEYEIDFYVPGPPLGANQASPAHDVQTDFETVYVFDGGFGFSGTVASITPALNSSYNVNIQFTWFDEYDQITSGTTMVSFTFNGLTYTVSQTRHVTVTSTLVASTSYPVTFVGTSTGVVPPYNNWGVTCALVASV